LLGEAKQDVSTACVSRRRQRLVLQAATQKKLVVLRVKRSIFFTTFLLFNSSRQE